MRIICFGDSNTYGYDPRSYFGGRYEPEYRWVDILADRLNCAVVNAGENGREIPWRPIEIQYFREMMERFPQTDLLIIMLGTNDLLQGNSAEETGNRMCSFLRVAEQYSAKIMLIAPPEIRLGEWVNSGSMLEESEKMGDLYQKAALEMRLDFADACKWEIPLAYDGVHFTEIGHQIFADAVCCLLKGAHQ